MNFTASIQKKLHGLFGVTTKNVLQCETGKLHQMLPSALLPIASKILARIISSTIQLPDRSQCSGGHRVSKTATHTSLLLTGSILESKTQTTLNRTGQSTCIFSLTKTVNRL